MRPGRTQSIISFKLLGLLLASSLSGIAHSTTLAEWCGKNGFSRLRPDFERSSGWSAFNWVYRDELREVASPWLTLNGSEAAARVDAVAGAAAKAEAVIAAMPSTTKAEKREVALAWETLRKKQAADPDFKILAAYALHKALTDNRAYESALTGVTELQRLRENPRQVLKGVTGDISLLTAQVRDLIPTTTQLLSDPQALTPSQISELRALGRLPTSSPEAIREEIKKALTVDERTYDRDLDRFIDALVGLNNKELKELDVKEHGKEDHGKEKTWMDWGHESYGSSYTSFPVYADALKIPPNGKVVELGAGPFRAAVSLNALRPGVEVVGYELFQTRVDAGNKVIERLGIGDRARLFQKNLSDPVLNLESADGYILMNPFPKETSENILNNLKEIALKNGKPFRILLYDAAVETRKAAEQRPWLKPEGKTEWGASTYGFYVYEVDPARLNEPNRRDPDQKSWLKTLVEKYSRPWWRPPRPVEGN